MIACPQADCASSNVENLPHYWQSLPSESPLRARYAPPATGTVNYWASLGLVGLGFVATVSGSVGLGLLLIAGGVAWGGFLYRRSVQVAALLAEWQASQICLACTRRF